MTVPSLDSIQGALDAKGYQYLDDGNLYNLNIIGIRAADQTPNSFDDLLMVSYKDETGPRLIYMACTTKPGSFYLLNPDNPLGTAILVENQYIDAFAKGLHHGVYSCLVQVKTLQLYRDDDKVNAFDYENITDGGVECGIHIHRASPNHQSTEVDNWSAGCQVVADPNSFAKLMELVDKSIGIRGNHFTYTLIKEEDLT